MNLLDENFPADQEQLLREWRVPHRQVGQDISRLGTPDENIIPLLHRLRGVTFFTQDQDFFKHRLCHRFYCLVWLDVKPGEAAFYLRRFLRHPHFNTEVKRIGTVARAFRIGVHFWHCGAAKKEFVCWPE